MIHHENFWRDFIGTMYGAYMGVLQIHPTDPGWLAITKTIGFAVLGGVGAKAGGDLYKIIKNKINGRRKIRS